MENGGVINVKYLKKEIAFLKDFFNTFQLYYPLNNLRYDLSRLRSDDIIEKDVFLLSIHDKYMSIIHNDDILLSYYSKYLDNY